MKIRVLVLLSPFLFANLASCSESECNYYVGIVKDTSRVNLIQSWADESIFTQTFTSKDFSSGGSIFGPGDRNFSPLSGVVPPEFVRGPNNAIRRVRTLGPVREAPAAIFFGERGYGAV